MDTSRTLIPASDVVFQWNRLQPLPDEEGFAAPFAGVTNTYLLVAGGANFPNGRPWEGGKKVWHDRVFLLETRAGSWREVGRLPRPLAYGVSGSTAKGVICAGGGDADEHFRDVFLLSWNNGYLSAQKLPNMPETSAFGSGAMMGGGLYVAGGVEKPDSVVAQHTFWRLRHSENADAWEVLPAWPGPPRMLAQVASIGETFYLFGGVELLPGPDGKPMRKYLRDAYRFDSSSGWKRLADLPAPVAAAPSPMPITSRGGLCLISGDDGSRAHLIGPDHPGFSLKIFIYNPANDEWKEAQAPAPISRATAPIIKWGDAWLVVSGEGKPGYRSPDVWTVEITQ